MDNATVEIRFLGNPTQAVAATDAVKNALRSLGIQASETTTVTGRLGAAQKSSAAATDAMALSSLKAADAHKAHNRQMGELEKGARGAAGAFTGLGRAMFFASNAFLTGAIIGSTMKKIYDASSVLQGAQDRLQTSLTNTGNASAAADAQAQGYVKTLSAQSEFIRGDLTDSLAKLVSATHDVGSAEHDLQVATEVARQKHIDLAAAVRITMLAQEGHVALLARLGIQIPKVTTYEDQLKIKLADLAAHHLKVAEATKLHLEQQAKLADQSLTGAAAIDALSKSVAGADDKFRHTSEGLHADLTRNLNELELSLSHVLNPVIDDATRGLDGWIHKITASGQAQRDLKEGISLVKDAFNALGDVLPPIWHALDTIAQTIGGWKIAFEIILSGYLAKKFYDLATSIGSDLYKAVVKIGSIGTAMDTAAATTTADSAVIEGDLATVGASAETAAGKVSSLKLALTGLTRLGAITIPIIIATTFKGDQGPIAGLPNYGNYAGSKYPRTDAMGHSFGTPMSDNPGMTSAAQSRIIAAWRLYQQGKITPAQMEAELRKENAYSPKTAPTGTGGGGVFPTQPGMAFPTATRGAIIGTPFSGTHAKAFNIAGGSDNWESENAIDIAVKVGTPVVAVEDGYIGPASEFGALGNNSGRFAGLRLHLMGKSGNEYYYAHLSQIIVRPGQPVTKGQTLGYSGSANGVAHLHFAEKSGNPMSFTGVPTVKGGGTGAFGTPNASISTSGADTALAAQIAGLTGTSTRHHHTSLLDQVYPVALRTQLASADTRVGGASNTTAMLAALRARLGLEEEIQKHFQAEHQTGKALLELRQQEAKVAREIAADQAKIARLVASSLIPAKLQEQILTAHIKANEADATDSVHKKLVAHQHLIQLLQQAEHILESEKETGATRVTQLKDEQRITEQIKTQHQDIVRLLKQEQQLKIATTERRILGISTTGSPVPASIEGLRHLAQVIGQQIANDPNATAAMKNELRKLNEVLKFNFMPPDVREAVRQQLQQLGQDIKTGVAAWRDAMKSSIEQNIVGPVLEAFDLMTQQLKDQLSIMVQGALGGFMYGGAAGTTVPAEQQLQQLQDEHQQAQMAQDMADAEKALAQAKQGVEDTAGEIASTRQVIGEESQALAIAKQQGNVLGQPGTGLSQQEQADYLSRLQQASAKRMTVDATAVDAAQKRIDDLKYQEQVLALQKLAALQKAEAEKQYKEATLVLEKQRAAERKSFAKALVQFEKDFANPNYAKHHNMYQALLALLQKYGLDPGSASMVGVMSEIAVAMIDLLQGVLDWVKSQGAGGGSGGGGSGGGGGGHPTYTNPDTQDAADNAQPGGGLSHGGGIGHIPMARGGIVTRPALALIGEAGPEAVIPLSRYSQRHSQHVAVHLMVESDLEPLIRGLKTKLSDDRCFVERISIVQGGEARRRLREGRL